MREDARCARTPLAKQLRNTPRRLGIDRHQGFHVNAARRRKTLKDLFASYCRRSLHTRAHQSHRGSLTTHILRVLGPEPVENPLSDDVKTKRHRRVVTSQSRQPHPRPRLKTDIKLRPGVLPTDSIEKRGQGLDADPQMLRPTIPLPAHSAPRTRTEHLLGVDPVVPAVQQRPKQRVLVIETAIGPQLQRERTASCNQTAKGPVEALQRATTLCRRRGKQPLTVHDDIAVVRTLRLEIQVTVDAPPDHHIVEGSTGSILD